MLERQNVGMLESSEPQVDGRKADGRRLRRRSAIRDRRSAIGMCEIPLCLLIYLLYLLTLLYLLYLLIYFTYLPEAKQCFQPK